MPTLGLQGTVNSLRELLFESGEEITSDDLLKGKRGKFAELLKTLEEQLSPLQSLGHNVLYSQTVDPIMTLAPPTWQFTGCNLAALKLFEVESETAFKQLGPWDLSPSVQPCGRPSAELAPQMIAHAMKNGSHFFDWSHQTRTGKLISCKVLLSRVDVNGESFLQASVRDVSTEQQALLALQTKTDELENVIENSPLGILELDHECRILRANPTYQVMLHYSVGELLARPLVDFIHPDDRTALSALDWIHSRRFECRFTCRYGQTIWARLSGRRLPDQGGSSRYLCMVEDVTALRQSRIETETIFETMSEGVIIQGEAGDIQKFNPAALKILGLSEDQLLGRTSMDPRWKSVKEDGSPYPGEEHPAMVALRTNRPVSNKVMGLTLPTGEERWIKITAVPFQAAAEPKVATSFADITEIIRTNSDLSYVSNHSLDLMCVVGKTGEFKRLSPSFEKVLGWPNSELLGEPYQNILHPDDVELTREAFAKLAAGEIKSGFENRLRTITGTYRLISWNGGPAREAGCMYATGRDVTEQRQTENWNRDILSAIDKAAIVAFTDGQGRITEVNDNFCRASGFSRAEAVEQPHWIFNAAAAPQDLWRELQSISAGEPWSGDIQARKKSGELYHVRSVNAPLRTVGGEVERYIAIQFDVTEQKELELELIEAQKTAKIGTWRYDLKTGQQTWSSEHYRIFEIEEPQAPATLHSLYRDRIHPEDRAQLDSIIERALLKGENFIYNHRVYLEGGARIKYVRGIGKVFRDEDGNPLSITGTCQDMTDLVSVQEQNKFILEALGIGIWNFNPQTQQLHWDQSMYRLYGLKESDFSGDYQAWESTLSPEGKERAIEELGQALRGEKDFNTTFEIVTGTGTRKFIGVQAVVLRDERQDPVIMYGLNWDKTVEYSLQQEMEKSKRLLQGVIDASPSTIFIMNREGVYLVVNSVFAQSLGLLPENVVGRSCRELYDPAMAQAMLANNAAILATGVPRTYEEQLLTGQTLSWCLVSLFPVRTAGGEDIGVGGIITNIQEAKDIRGKFERELELERAKSMHNAKLASLGEMSAGIAHEINNPLAVISGTIPLLVKFKDDPVKWGAKLEALAKASERITKIVRGLKKFSRSSEGSVFKRESLEGVITESLALTEAKAKRHSTAVTVEQSPGLSIWCDEVEMIQVLVNLINNAIDAIKTTDERWVKIVAFREELVVVLQVIDSGSGISREVEEKLFQPFFTTKPVGEGTGLGLSIAKGILDNHKAKFFLNRSFQTTCFEIRFAAHDSTEAQNVT